MINWTPSTGARTNHEVSKPYLFSEESEFSWRDLGSNVIVLSKYWMTVILKRQWNWSHPLKFTELELMSESLREINLETKSVSTALHSVLYKLVFIERTVPLNSSLSLHQDANSAASPAPTVWTAQEIMITVPQKGASSLSSLARSHQEYLFPIPTKAHCVKATLKYYHEIQPTMEGLPEMQWVHESL